MKTMTVFFLSFLVVTSAFAKPSKKVTLISMDIPPFMSPKLPEQGAAIYGLKQIFKKIGYELEVRFVPIQRTRNVGMSDERINGFFPSFVDDDFVQGMTLSKTIYKTPWVIAERKEKPVHWKTPADLLKYKGGNVGGYTLRSQVADVFKSHEDALELAPGDIQNILKLANKRVDYIFIDQNVLKFILATDPQAIPYADTLQVNPKIVALNEYGVAFKQNGRSKKIMDEFNKVVSEEEFTKAVDGYIKMYMAPRSTSSK
ncbi:substrate-binding periplasmic protein [Bdellovibrio sp. HCB-162]|uniref:substrate-binding periplasmic protein n=1 Tax=Bdellovibrio sp. HCB-162 TaxID=3394234 RepID=UPI0039BC46E7